MTWLEFISSEWPTSQNLRESSRFLREAALSLPLIHCSASAVLRSASSVQNPSWNKTCDINDNVYVSTKSAIRWCTCSWKTSWVWETELPSRGCRTFWGSTAYRKESWLSSSFPLLLPFYVKKQLDISSRLCWNFIRKLFITF